MFVGEAINQKQKWKSTVTTLIQSQEQFSNVGCQTAPRRARPKMHRMYIIIKHILKDREKNLKENCDFLGLYFLVLME